MEQAEEPGKETATRAPPGFHGCVPFSSQTKRGFSTPQRSGPAPLPLTILNVNPAAHKGWRWTDGEAKNCPHMRFSHAG